MRDVRFMLRARSGIVSPATNKGFENRLDYRPNGLLRRCGPGFGRVLSSGIFDAYKGRLRVRIALEGLAELPRIVGR